MRPKNACSVVEMHMLSEGHMLGSCGKNQNVETQLRKIPSAVQVCCLVVKPFSD